MLTIFDLHRDLAMQNQIKLVALIALVKQVFALFGVVMFWNLQNPEEGLLTDVPLLEKDNFLQGLTEDLIVLDGARFGPFHEDPDFCADWDGQFDEKHAHLNGAIENASDVIILLAIE